jgi:uncharacterized protein with von Willebrand factor type A (vWA) domain
VSTAPATVPFDQVLVGFGHALRRAGVAAHPDRVRCLLEAVTHLDPLSRDEVYWAGRLTCCSRVEDLPLYDRVFEAWFRPEAATAPAPAARVEVERAVGVEDPTAAGDRAGEEDVLTGTASALEVLRHKDVATLDAAERAAVHRLIAAIEPDGPHRRSRRTAPAHRGRLDRRATTAAMLRAGGEPARPRHRQRRLTPRRVVLLLDVSGSMKAYADAFLRFGHALTRARPRTEVLTVGTRLTRVTGALRQPTADAALTAFAAAVPDWSGGTRLGDNLRELLTTWGRRGQVRGAVVVIASDGWERGDATVLREQMERLHRLAHRVIWVNPHKGKDGYAPATAGMQAALPSVDAFLAGHSVATLERLARLARVVATDHSRHQGVAHA